MLYFVFYTTTNKYIFEALSAAHYFCGRVRALGGLSVVDDTPNTLPKTTTPNDFFCL